MVKITKKAFIEEALKKYSIEKIDEAIYCNAEVILKDGKQGEFNFKLTNRGKKSKIDKIRSAIRSFLLNIKPDESNKRYDWNTSSENIESIKISLKFK